MSSVYTGDPTTVSNSLSRTITDVTNVSPPVVTTSVAHLFATGDRVRISGVLGATGANGDFTITVLSSTTFSLDGAAAPGVYTSGGTVVDRALTPQLTIPSDGDNLDASSVNAAFEALADRTQFLVAEVDTRLDPIRTIGLLKAIDTTDLPNDTVRHVRAQGLYTLDTSLSVAEDSPWILAPNTGPGRWVNGVATEPTTDRYYGARDLVRWYVPRRAKTTSPPASVLDAASVEMASDGSVTFLTTDAGTTNQDAVVIDLTPCLIHGAYLDHIDLQVAGAGGHVGLPAKMPSFGIFRRSISGGPGALITGTWTDDPSASAAAYDASHTVTLTPDPLATALIVDRTQYSYEIVAWNEGSTNALAGFLVGSLLISQINIPHAGRS